MNQGSQSQKLIDAIRDQTDGVPAYMVFVIDIVSVRFGGSFTPEIKAELQKYEYLQMLTLNDCGIKSLQNFPNLPRLIRLDMVFNQIPGKDLKYIAGSRHLQTLMLGANKIEKIQDLKPLKTMKQLLQLDLINNPVSLLPGFRNKMFQDFSTLLVLDTLDKSGKDAYTNMTMMQSVARVPDNLFDRSRPMPIPAPVAHVHRAQQNNLNRALARTGSLNSMSADPVIRPAKKSTSKKVTKNSRGAKAKASKITTSRSSSSRSGLVFPVGRIRRKIKENIQGVRVGKTCAVYMAATLQYLSAELLQIAGNEAKREKRTRITPIMIRDCLKHDDQMHQLLKNVTLNLV